MLSQSKPRQFGWQDESEKARDVENAAVFAKPSKVVQARPQASSPPHRSRHGSAANRQGERGRRSHGVENNRELQYYELRGLGEGPVHPAQSQRAQPQRAQPASPGGPASGLRLAQGRSPILPCIRSPVRFRTLLRQSTGQAPK